MPNKIQEYTVTFNADSPYTHTADAMSSIGQNIDLKWRNFIDERSVGGTVTFNNASLSDDGLTLNVVRTFTQEAYDDYIAMGAGNTNFIQMVENLSHVSSFTNSFRDE